MALVQRIEGRWVHLLTLLKDARTTSVAGSVCAVVGAMLWWSLSGVTLARAAQLPPSHDCPASIPRHPGSTYYAGTITVHAGAPADCVVKLPDGVILRAGGGSAPNAPAARAIFRVNGVGIDQPGGLNILVSSSPVPSPSVPDFRPLQLPAHLTLPKNTVVVRWDPSAGRWVSQSNGVLQAWALYKVLRHNVQPVRQATVSLPALLPATGLGATAFGTGVGGQSLGALERSDVGALLVALLLVVAVLALLWRDVRRGVQPGASPFWTRLLLAFIAVVACALAGLRIWTRYGAAAEQPQYGDVMAQGAAPTKPGTAAPPDRLTLTRLGIDTPIVVTSIVNKAWQAASYAAGYLSPGVTPGQRGVLAISGHDDTDGAVFSRLGAARDGDIVSVYVGKSIYHYKVVALRIVTPQQIGVLRPTSGAVLTLITCTPPGVDTQRLVVRATLLP